MPYSRQRKAANQVMQNLGDGHPLQACVLLASLCISCAVGVLTCLRTCVLLCPRTSFPGPPLQGWCRPPRSCMTCFAALRCLL